MKIRVDVLFLQALISFSAVVNAFSTRRSVGRHGISHRTEPITFSAFDTDADPYDLRGKKTTVSDYNEEDNQIRDALKRELLLLSSVSNRGDYCSLEEQSLLIDLVSQLEALNPTKNPAYHMEGEWDLCLSSTQSFRSSPFFQTIRAAMGDENRQLIENVFDLHDRATSVSRVGRIRQTISGQRLVSEVDLEVGLTPGIPIRMKGTVQTTASMKVVSPDMFETQIQSTLVIGSNIPILNQFLEDPKMQLPVGDIYGIVLGKPPSVTTRTFYVDEGLRIVRDVDDNFFVFTRA